MCTFLRHLVFHLLLVTCATAPVCWAGEDWLPIPSEELKMTAEPKSPGAPAIYLYRQVDRDDVDYRETTYARIKILTEEGRKYADIEIPFVKDSGDIKNIQARTIHPDGSIVKFDGQVYEKTIVKAKGVKFLAKTFTMPDVHPGSIIEYRYTRMLPEGWVYDSRWLLSEELFTKHANFSLRKAYNLALVWSWPRGLPAGTKVPEIDKKHIVRLEVNDVPAFQIEDYMPPQDEMKYRVEFTYTRSDAKETEAFWKEEAKSQYSYIDAFTDKHKAMEKAVAEIISASDTPEQKLQKIYARCQKIRNTSFEREKTQKERDREKLKEIHNVEDVWKRGYATGYSITWLFLALARAAGFQASPVLVATRDTHFFDPKYRNSYDLNTNVVLVKLDGKDQFFDPGVAFAPYGLLPWSETGVMGFRIEKDGGTWLTTSTPAASTSGINRTGTFQLDDSGGLEGKAVITFRGLSALRQRLEERDDDDADRKKSLEDDLKSSIPLVSEVELTNHPDWDSSSNTLAAEFHVKIPGWASSAGRRTLLPASIFSAGERHLFESENRFNPIYIAYPYTDSDNVTITPTSGLQISSLPQPKKVDAKACVYSQASENRKGELVLSRQMMVNITLVGANNYPALRSFFQAVRHGDEEQIVLAPAGK